MTDLSRVASSHQALTGLCALQAPGKELSWNQSLPSQGRPPHSRPVSKCLLFMKDQVATGLMEAARPAVALGTPMPQEVGKQSLGKVAPFGSLTLCVERPGRREEERWEWSTVHPGISQPESPPSLAAPEHSLWPTATEMSACQDTWRRKKTRHQKKPKNKQKNLPAPETNRTPGPRSHQIRKTPCTLRPGKRNTVQHLAALLKGNCHPTLRLQLTGR